MLHSTLPYPDCNVLICFLGRSLLGLYRDSVAEMLMALYNEHHWQVWKFDRAPRSYYRRYPEVQREFVHWFEKEHKIDSLELWYNYSAVEIEAAGGTYYRTTNALVIFKIS